MILMRGDFLIINKIFLAVIYVITLTAYSQEYERGSVDLGVGAVISVGLQEEVGFDIRLQYTSSTRKTNYIAEYNRFFIKEFENTEVYNEFGITYNRRLIQKEAIHIRGGLGYIVNDYQVLRMAEDTSNLFFSTDNLNHGLELKLSGMYDISKQIQVFVEVNIKSFGKRYDTFAFGLTYSLGI